MNFEFDFKNLSPAEVDARCRQIAAQKNALEDDLHRQESDLQQMRANCKQHRQQAQMFLERLILMLMPDLSEPIKLRLAQIFPHHAEIIRDSQPVSRKGFWRDISTFFSDLLGSAPNPLEERRVLLRNILWQLSEIPPNAREFTELIRAFLQAKGNYFALDETVNQREAQANRIVEQLNELSRRLQRCHEWIHGRPDEDERDDDSRIYNRTSNDSSSSQTNIIVGSPAPSSDSSRFDSSGSGDTAKASFEATGDSAAQSMSSSSDASFSGFGGGGDFDGGGAGGSWENYS
ncbi:MAG TPA: hypothetical protein VK400_00950 [Pyrinomonadaceae bacterium]|nr:hypothetical protein [Pyrinomonadaceae bacterium]